jgi:hypothetical protein
VTIVDSVRLISNSEVQTFKDCPRKWWLAWLRGLVPIQDSPVGAAATGSRYHAAVAVLYVPDGETPGDPLAKLDEIHQEVSEAFLGLGPSEGDDDFTPSSVEVYDKLLKAFDLERAMVEGYIQWLEETGADAQLEVIAPETYVEANFPVRVPDLDYRSFPVKLIGKLDARTRNRVTGGIRFIDHKTVGSLFDPMLHLNQQMLHYHLIEWIDTGKNEARCEGALYNMARKVKRTAKATPPFFARTHIDHNIHEIENYRRQLRGVIGEMIRAEAKLSNGVNHHYVVPSRPSRDCTWKCQFLKICRMFDDGSRVEDAIEGLYEVRDPLSYYGGREKGSDE